MAMSAPAIVDYYKICSLLITPRRHIVAYIAGKPQKIISREELDDYFTLASGQLVPKENIIGGSDDEPKNKIVVFG